MTWKTKRDLILIGFVIGVLLAVFLVNTVFAGVDKVYWCHTEPNGNSQTLHLPLQALEQAGHVNASGNPLHAGDYAGQCVEVEPTATPTPTPCERDEEVTPTPADEPEVTPTIEVTPTAGISATPTPVEEECKDFIGPYCGWSPKPENPNDGLSDGRSSSPQGVSNYDGSPVIYK